MWGGLLGSKGFLPQSPTTQTHWQDPSGEESSAGSDFGCRPGSELWLFAKVFCSGMSFGSLRESVCVPTRTRLHSCTSSVYRQELPWAAFLKTQVLYYQVNFLSALFAWSKSDILWPVRFMAVFPRSLFSPPINTSGYKPSSDSLLFCLLLLSCFVRNKNRGILKHFCGIKSLGTALPRIPDKFRCLCTDYYFMRAMPDRNVSNQKHEETTTRSSGSALAGSAHCTWKGWGSHVPKPHKKIKRSSV